MGGKKRVTLSAKKREMLKLFMELFRKGFDRNEIIDFMGLKDEDYEDLLDIFYADAEDMLRGKTPIRTYSEYVTKKVQLAMDLELFKDQLREKSENSRTWNQAQAYVAAVNAQSTIYDSVIKTGQDLGIVVRSPERVLMVGGKDTRELDFNELNDALKQELTEVKSIIEKNRKKRLSPKDNNLVALYPQNTASIEE